MEKETIAKLIFEAKSIANQNFCANHSKYTVGASLMTKSGKIYPGFNIENDGIQSICAERVAFSKALSELEKEFSCILVMGKKLEDEHFRKALPCGYCRQFMSEYVDEDFMVYSYDEKEDKLYSYSLKELLPENFSL